jgi:hypothetical protein
MTAYNIVLDFEYSQGITWREYIVNVMKIKGIKGTIYPIYAYKQEMDVPILIGFCGKGETKSWFFDYQLNEVLKSYVLTIGEFIDISLWNTISECLLYHGMAIIADEKVQVCAEEFGWLEAYLASHRGNYENYQELAADPNL